MKGCGPDRPRRYGRGARAVSLIETLVVIGVVAIIMLLFSQVFASSTDLYAKLTARNDNETSAILASRVISEMARGASQVLETKTINGTAYASSDDQLVLEMPAINSSWEIIDGSYDYIAFYRDGTEPEKIFSDTEAATGSYRITGQKLVADNNIQIAFRYNNADITDASRVSVYMVNQQVTRGATVTTRAWTSIFLRNR
ncbi:hypothetical protein AMJ57_00010 [Parcubacteria bacterium SG8_24]|nr:MAG: hypothetical protein AMJ57_00010 [Parcubacteria bacterium SG8_24]